MGDIRCLGSESFVPKRMSNAWDRSRLRQRDEDITHNFIANDSDPWWFNCEQLMRQDFHLLD
ncbi:MAG: hypothetical protein ABW185_24380 [Sedimenticola sp.]